MNQLQKVTIKSMTDKAVTVAGYGVVFGGVDLDGETFGPDTDYMLDLVPQKPVLYDHGMNEAVAKSIIGFVGKAAPDDTGLWVEAELSRHSAYMNAILDLIEKGALGWSSGTVGQLALRDGNAIKRWPIVELSLTPTPAEPRTLGVEQLKALTELVPELERLAQVADTKPATLDESQTEAGTPSDDISEPTEAEGETAQPEAGSTPAAAVPEADDGEHTDNEQAADAEDDENELDEFYAMLDEFAAAISDKIRRLL